MTRQYYIIINIRRNKRHWQRHTTYCGRVGFTGMKSSIIIDLRSLLLKALINVGRCMISSLRFRKSYNNFGYFSTWNKITCVIVTLWIEKLVVSDDSLNFTMLYNLKIQYWTPQTIKWFILDVNTIKLIKYRCSKVFILWGVKIRHRRFIY